jgi:probable rRNA maturation factor
VAVRFLPGCRGRIGASELRLAARAVMVAEGVAPEVGVEVVLADAETVRDLNRRYRGRDEPTDVLSFAASEVEVAFVEGPEDTPSLGEVVVCLPVAEQQAVDAGHNLKGEITHLLVHGILHITGHDHEDPNDGARMKGAEDAILENLGHAGQYAHGH